MSWLVTLLLGVFAGATAREFYEFAIKRFFLMLRRKVKEWTAKKKT